MTEQASGMNEQVPSKDVLPQGWITLGAAYNFLRARILAGGDHFILDHFDCKYINARVDMRTGKVLLSPGNGRSAYEREIPHCSTCSCPPYEPAPEPEALRREQVKAICHALSGTCVMVTDPHRPLCSVETCLAMEAAARAAQPPRDGQ